MSSFQRIKSIVFGVLMVLFALIMFWMPEDWYDTVTVLMSLSLMLYGVKLLFFYFSMARHMVGGKIMLYQAIIILDLSLFTISMASMSSFTIIIYLLGIFGFTGVIDILRAFEAKSNCYKHWKLKFLTGCICVVFVIIMAVLGLIFKNTAILVYGYCISLFYSGVVRIVTAFRKTAMVYIQ